MRASTWWLACLALTALVACTPDGDETVAARPRPQAGPTEAGSAPVGVVEGGTAVVAVPDAPATLNPWLADPAAGVDLVTRPMLAPLWRVLPDGTYEPWLLAGEPTVRGGDSDEPFTVTYRIRDEAVWSDGQPVDGGDLLFTLRQCRDVAPREDCAAVDVERSRADGKQATVVFERPIAAWRTILSTLPVLPEHELRGRDPASTWTRQVSVSSGPFRFGSAVPGERLTLVRNERWWGERAQLDRIEFRFGELADITEIADGTADVTALPAAPDVVDRVRGDPRLRADVAPGRRWLALDFNVDTPELRTSQVRRALAEALDRATIIAELIRPVSSEHSAPDALPGGPPPADAQTPALPAHDEAAAARALDAAGCPVAADGLRACDGQPLELTLLTTEDDWQQSIVAEYVQMQLAGVGVRVSLSDAAGRSPGESEPSEPEAAGDQSGEGERSEPAGGDQSGEGERSEPAGGDQADAAGEPAAWDLRITTVSRAEDPAVGGRRWRCGDPANTQSFCVAQYDALLRRAAQTVDGDARADLHARAALLLAQQLPTYPLYELPELLVHAPTVRGPAVNAGPWGLTWNVEEWARAAG